MESQIKNFSSFAFAIYMLKHSFFTMRLESLTNVSTHTSLTPNRIVFHNSAIWAKIKNAENQVISAFFNI